MNTIEEVLNNEDLVKIANKAACTFSESLSQDEIKTCIMSAVWQACDKFDKSRNTKFSTYLYKIVAHECLRQKRSIKKEYENIYKNYSDLKAVTSKYSYKEMEKIDLLEEIKSCSDPDIIYDKYYNNLSLKDIAKKHGVSRETIRFKLKKNLNFLKVRLS